MLYVDYVYEIIRGETEGMDAIYEDYILERVGSAGLNHLKSSKLIESCGVVNGRQLYVLCDKE